MNREDLTEQLLDIKRQSGWRWKPIPNSIGCPSPILIAAACGGR